MGVFAGAGVTSEGRARMADNDSRREPIKVVLPAEPPKLTPGAARALLRILVKAYDKQAAEAGEASAAAETCACVGGGPIPGSGPIR